MFYMYCKATEITSKPETVLLNPVHYNPGFQRPCQRRNLKTLWKKENAGNRNFLFFPLYCILTFLGGNSSSEPHFTSRLHSLEFGPVQISVAW